MVTGSSVVIARREEREGDIWPWKKQNKQRKSLKKSMICPEMRLCETEI